MNEYLGRAFVEDIIKVVVGVFLVGLLVGGFCFLLYVGEKQRQQALAEFDYEKLVFVGKDLEFAICDKMNPCVNCRSRDHLALLIQRVVRQEWDAADKRNEERQYTFYTVYCGRCGRKTMSENKNLADAIYEWETRQ